MTATQQLGPRVALVGDSILGGLGVKGRSYGHIVADSIGASKVLGLARSGFTVRTGLGRLDKLASFAPDLVIVGVGGSEGLVHAPHWMQRLMDRGPANWKGIDGLEPDLWLPDTRRRRLRRRSIMTVKLALKHVSLAAGPGYRRLSLEEYCEGLANLLDALCRLNCEVVVVGVHQPDGRLWPRSPSSCRDYEAQTYAIAQRYPEVTVVETKHLLSRWDDYAHDHAHPSASGHAKIADEVLRQLGG